MEQGIPVSSQRCASSEIALAAEVNRRREVIMSNQERRLGQPSGPGRIFWTYVCNPAGERIEKVGGFVAHKLGIGPSAHAQAIMEILDVDLESRLDALHGFMTIDSASQKSLGWIRRVRKHCDCLTEYMQPSKAKLAQIEAFKWIVLLITWYPGVRMILRSSQHAKDIDSEINCSSLWVRNDDDHDAAWQFYQSLATFCLSNTINLLAPLMEFCPPSALGEIPNSESSIVEKLLHQFLDLHVSQQTRHIALRYITGILRLKSFWENDRTCYVTLKLLKEVAILLRYLSEHMDLFLGLSKHQIFRFDIEGIDMLGQEIIRKLPQQQKTVLKLDNYANWGRLVSEIQQLLDSPDFMMVLPRTYVLRNELMKIQTSQESRYIFQDRTITIEQTGKGARKDSKQSDRRGGGTKPILPGRPFKDPVKNRTFGVDLHEQMTRDMVTVPKVMQKCCEAIEKWGISEKGLYLISGVQSKVLKLKENLDQDIDAVDFESSGWISDINNITSVLKLWLRELPEPLFTIRLRESFIGISKIDTEQTRHALLHEQVNQLPDANYATLKYFLGHLYKISQNQVQTSMSNCNLSIVVGPTLFGVNQPDEAWFSSAYFQNRAVETLLDHYTEIFIDDISKSGWTSVDSGATSLQNGSMRRRTRQSSGSLGG